MRKLEKHLETLAAADNPPARYRLRKGIFDLLKYKPTPEQEAVHFADIVEPDIRGKQVVGGEQSGKSFMAGKETISRYPEAINGNGLFWFAGEGYELARREFEYCLEDAQKLGFVVSYSLPKDKDSPCTMELLGGVQIKTKSLKDPMKIAMESPDGIVICEAAQTSWSNVERCRTRVSASRGWLFLEGTMEGSMGYYAEKYKEWQGTNPEKMRSFSIPSWTNKYFYPGGYDDPQIKFYRDTLPEDVFLERFGGIPCPLSQIVIKEFRNEIHVGDYPFNSDLDVDVAIDPGYHGAYSVLAVQWVAGTGYVVDEIYLSSLITEEIIQIAQNKPWFKKAKYGAIDIAAKQHQAMPAPLEIWQKLTRITLRTNKVDEEEGINRLRSFLKSNPTTYKPMLFINQTCKGLISELGGGRSPVIGGGAWLRDKNTGKPLKKNNHSAKALIYLLVDRYGYITVERKAVGVVSYSPFM